MWQKVSDRQEVRYNSATTTRRRRRIPAGGQDGRRADCHGQDLARPARFWNATRRRCRPIPGWVRSPCRCRSNRSRSDRDWHLSNEVRVRRQDGQQLRVKTRLVYTLKSVKTGVATIAVKTEVITPVNDPQIKAQLVQQLTDGELKFDIDAGRVLVPADRLGRDGGRFQRRRQPDEVPGSVHRGADTGREGGRGTRPRSRYAKFLPS